MAAITYEHATVQYPGAERPSVNSLDLDIADGEFLVLVGPSGCGKSTSLRALAGLENVTGGRSGSATGTSRTWRRRTATSRWCSRTTPCIRT